MPSPFRMAVFITILATLSSCVAMHTVERAEVTSTPAAATDRFARFASPDSQRVAGYTTLDGRYHAFDGWAQVAGDSMLFRRAARAQGWPPERVPGALETVATSELASVRSVAPSPGRTVVAVCLLGVMVAVFWMASQDWD